MATTKTPKPGTAVANRSSTNVVSIKERIKQEAAEIAGRIAPPSGDNIQITQDKHFKLPNGAKSPGPLELIIVDFVSLNQFYPGTYDSKNIVPPVCFALSPTPSTLVPSPNSPEKQSDSCKGCPNDEFGTASNGSGKACKNARKLACLPPDADADTELAILSVSPTGIKAFDSFVSSIANAFGVPPLGVITEVSFDPASTYPSLRFGNPRPCSDEQLEMAYGRKEEARKRLMVEPDVSKYVKAPVKKAAGGRR